MISDKRLRELYNAESKLNALEAGGVDNWDFYDDSLKEWHEENKIEDAKIVLINDIQEVIAESMVTCEDSRNGVYIVETSEDQLMVCINGFLESIKEDE